MKQYAQLIDVKSVQKLIAMTAFTLPVFLVFGEYFLGSNPRFYPTISQYVHGSFGNVFIGMIFALGALFFTYKGYPENHGPIPLSDHQLANIAATSLILVATCDTLLCGMDAATPAAKLMEWVHVISAIISFFCLGLFCLFYFTQEKDHDNSPITTKRIAIYRLCGYIIFGAMGIAAIVFLLGDKSCPTHVFAAPVLWLEWLMIWAFALAWTVKGRMILC